jgi:hypothetical protein
MCCNCSLAKWTGPSIQAHAPNQDGPQNPSTPYIRLPLAIPSPLPPQLAPVARIPPPQLPLASYPSPRWYAAPNLIPCILSRAPKVASLADYTRRSVAYCLNCTFQRIPGYPFFLGFVPTSLPRLGYLSRALSILFGPVVLTVVAFVSSRLSSSVRLCLAGLGLVTDLAAYLWVIGYGSVACWI